MNLCDHVASKILSSNRTFMELKLITILSFLVSIDRSNRTFMELKWHSRPRGGRGSEVLIAPLWNWNAFGQHLYDWCNEGSNRTFMELKFDCWQVFHYIRGVLIAPLWNWNRHCLRSPVEPYSSNRTFMELKYNWYWCSCFSFPCSNRTFMELKWRWL